MKIVVIISAIIEWDAVKEILAPGEVRITPYGEVFDSFFEAGNLVYFHAGWGKAASAGGMQYIIDHYHPDLAVNLGTCGGFDGVSKLGEIVLVERAFMYDIVELMGQQEAASDYYASNLDLSWLPEPTPHPVRRGAIASADSDLLPEKISQIQARGAIAADWESAPLAWVAAKNDVPLLILRAVSDLVNDRGGEAYDNIELFKGRTREIMRRLITQLPDWLASIQI